MRIALINLPYFNIYFMENIKFVERRLRVLPPLSLMYVSSLLKNHGHDCIIIDAVAENLSKREILKKLRKFNPEMIGFSILVPARGKLFRWASYIKKKLSLPIIVGGHILLYYPEAILSNEFIDYAIIGSAIPSLPKLIDAIENGRELDAIEGIAFKKNGKIVVNYPKDIRKKLDLLPFPDREGINNLIYNSIASEYKPYTIMVTSSGCIYKCDFCPMGRLPYEERSIKKVLNEIEKCVYKYGIKEIDIQDENFLLDKERAIKIMEEIIKRRINIKFSCRARVDNIDKEILEIMKKSGCRLIMFEIESGNEEILRREHKGITKNQIIEAIETTKNMGIKTLGFFIIGHKGESKDTIKETIKFSKELPLDYVQFFHMVVKPGTKLYDEIKESMGYDYFDAVLRGNEKEKDFPLPWTELSNREIRKWVAKAYFSFYFRRGYFDVIVKMLIQWIKSFINGIKK